MAGGGPDPFARWPKQFLILPEGFRAPAPWDAAPVRARVAGWRVLAAPAAPVVPVRGADGAGIGVLIGWAILGGRLLGEGDAVELPPGGSVEADVLADLGGRAVCLWRAAEGAVLELDSAGFLPAVFAPDAGIVAASSGLLAEVSPRPADAEVAAIHDFPRRRGYLPFGLTHHRGVVRLLPGHRLALDAMAARRVWPPPALAAAPRLAEGAAAEAAARGIAEGLRARALAVAAAAAAAGIGPRLNLTGGYDSRLVLAALRPVAGDLVCQTVRHRFGAFAQDNALDLHLARRLAARAGARHETIRALAPDPACDAAAREAWLGRTGRTYYEALSDLALTLERAGREALTLDGTGCEMLRAITWAEEDLGAPALSREGLLARLRLPPARPIEAAAEAWLAGLPPCDAPRALDLAKIEMMHGCWFGPTVYGLGLPVPTLSPFPTRAAHAALMRLPDLWRRSGGAWRACLGALWPELGAVAVNRAEGWARLRFLPAELKGRAPKRLKRWVRPYR